MEVIYLLLEVKIQMVDLVVALGKHITILVEDISLVDVVDVLDIMVDR